MSYPARAGYGYGGGTRPRRGVYLGPDGGGPCWNLCLYLLAIFLPPLAVFFKVACGLNFWLNILLTILGWIPGVLHAWYVIATRTARRHAKAEYYSRRY